jgi:hypothetical protein
MAGKESVAETVCGVAVGFGGGLGVYAQVELGVGVTESSLSRLDVDTFEDEPGGVGPAEVVERRLIWWLGASHCVRSRN